MTEDRAFLRAILERPEDDSAKLIYADWLEEQGDPRGEFLREMVEFRHERALNPEQRRRHDELSAELAALQAQERRAMEDAIGRRTRPPTDPQRRRRERELQGQLADLSKRIRRQVPTRLRELAAAFDPDWLAVVSDPEIEGCGKCASFLRFDFICERSWADMNPTGDDNVRHCEACRKNVHFCDNIAEAREHSHQGHCIAVDLGVIRREGDLRPRMMILGLPSMESLRQGFREDVDPVSQARLDARRQGKKNKKEGRRR